MKTTFALKQSIVVTAAIAAALVAGCAAAPATPAGGATAAPAAPWCVQGRNASGDVRFNCDRWSTESSR